MSTVNASTLKKLANILKTNSNNEIQTKVLALTSTFCLHFVHYSGLPWEYVKPISLHELHATLTDYCNKIATMLRPLQSNEGNITHQIDLYIQGKRRGFLDRPWFIYGITNFVFLPLHGI